MGANRFESIGANLAASVGTTVTSSATVNTMGSWAQLIASTAFHARWLYLTVGLFDSGDHLIDIGVGGSGSEQVYIPSIGKAGRTYGGTAYELPVSIPPGTRISARSQAAAAGSKSSYVSGVLSATRLDTSKSYGRLMSLTAVSATSRSGPELDTGIVANTKPATWTTLLASAPYRIKGLQILAMSSNGAMADAGWLVDIGVGAALSEQLLIPNLAFYSGAAQDTILPSDYPIMPVSIEAGTRIAMLGQCSITDSSDRKFDIGLMAFG